MLYRYNLTSSLRVLLKIAHPSRVYALILYTAHIASDSQIAHISVDEMYIQKDPHVGDVRFHQEFGKRLGNGNINLQRCKQFPPWTMSCPNQQPPPFETKLVFRIIAITFLGPFQSTWGRFFALILRSFRLSYSVPFPRWCGTAEWNNGREQMACTVYITLFFPPSTYEHSVVYVYI